MADLYDELWISVLEGDEELAIELAEKVLTEKYLPAGFAYAGKFAAKAHIPETDTANAKFTHERTRTTTYRAAIITARAELRSAFRFYCKGCT